MNKLLRVFIKYGYMDETNKHIVKFGLKRLRSMLLDLVSASICSFFFYGEIGCGIIFEVSYVLLRIYVGGYHASTERRCSYLSCISMCLGIYAVSLMNNVIAFYGLFCIAFVSCWLCAPVESKNKPLCLKEKRVFREKSRAIISMELLIMILLKNVGKWWWSNSIGVAIIFVAIGISPVKISQFRRRT